MTIRSLRRPALALALLASPAWLAAQQNRPASAAPPAAAPTQQQLQSWYGELQQIGARIEAAQAQALEDPALGEKHRALGAEIEAAVVRVDSTLAGLPQRVQQLDEQLREAYRQRDQARFEQLAQQGQQLEARFLDARAKALAQPPLAARMRAFEAELEQKMLELDPELPRLLERGRYLQARLEAAVTARAAAQP